MARRPRLGVPGIPQHVIHRGNNRQATFFAERDYRMYLESLADACLKHGCLVHHYTLMTNHVHLLLTPITPDALAQTMRDAGRRYVQYVNHTYNRTGTLWEGRYKANLIDCQTYFFACCCYIELNPVRAAIVQRPDDYRWSSYRHYASGHSDRYVSPHAEYTALGYVDEIRQQAYRALFRYQPDKKKLDAIRASISSGWPVGSNGFKDSVAAALNRTARPPKRGRPFKPRQQCEPDPNYLVEM